MKSNNKPSTSQNLQSYSSDDDDEHLENLSTEEGINVSNAFDIDMIGCFYFWLENKKSSIFDDDNDFTLFHEISDYLEASAIVYSYFVDNLTETTSRQVEQFKSMNLKKVQLQWMMIMHRQFRNQRYTVSKILPVELFHLNMDNCIWSRAILFDFIKMYEYHKCLWKINDQNDYNKQKMKAYNELVNLVKDLHSAIDQRRGFQSTASSRLSSSARTRPPTTHTRRARNRDLPKKKTSKFFVSLGGSNVAIPRSHHLHLRTAH